MKKTLSTIQKLLKLGLASDAKLAVSVEQVMLPGPVFVRIMARLQKQCASSPADPRAAAVMAAFAKRPILIGTYFSRTLSSKKPFMLYANGLS